MLQPVVQRGDDSAQHIIEHADLETLEGHRSVVLVGAPKTRPSSWRPRPSSWPVKGGLRLAVGVWSAPKGTSDEEPPDEEPGIPEVGMPGQRPMIRTGRQVDGAGLDQQADDGQHQAVDGQDAGFDPRQ